MCCLVMVGLCDGVVAHVVVSLAFFRQRLALYVVQDCVVVIVAPK